MENLFALFTMAKKIKATQEGKWIIKMWHIHIMDINYSAPKDKSQRNSGGENKTRITGQTTGGTEYGQKVKILNK